MNNQTIDGVLVSRELLERFVSDVEAHNYGFEGLDEVRALLDAPTVQWLAMEVNGKPWVIKEGPNADKWRAMGYELLPVEPGAQPQGEPVAEIVSKYGDPEAFGERELITLKDISKFPYGTKLYAEQSAPVSVTRPTHANPPPGTEPSGTHHDNDGLDEMRKPTCCGSCPGGCVIQNESK